LKKYKTKEGEKMARYQYETSPRKIQERREPKKRKNQNINKNNKNEKINIKTSSKIKMIGLVLIGFAVFFTISYRNAVIDAKYSQIKSLKSDLAEIQKQNEQLEANVESSLNLKTIQEEAEEKLGMKALSTDQIEYIKLEKNDFVESSTNDEDEENYIQKAISFIKKLIK
jgi:hypothetical protein